MVQPPPKRPVLADRGRAKKAAREARLAAALRRNLRRRKTQQRARAEAAPGDQETP